ncbi:transcriptional repressor [Dokdonella koreensis]|uniref:Ferric uptake regulator, Fur family n=1 Tax=Dokdonella koreensis DS-123 TaxID=1300342 RepID=A0A167GW81_9GAMM|nr:transcriptional repressor [Dokdonella koreensis]ANB17886.1 Ferric uptake regulator, Fur family [Dokdonella koreensis DS-123]
MRFRAVAWLLAIATLGGHALPLDAAAKSDMRTGASEETVLRGGRRAAVVAAVRRRPSRPTGASSAPLRQRLHSAGLAATVPRQQVLALLSEREHAPMCGRTIYRGLDYAVSQVTVHRVLAQLESAGLVERVRCGGDRPLFRLRS